MDTIRITQCAFVLNTINYPIYITVITDKSYYGSSIYFVINEYIKRFKK